MIPRFHRCPIHLRPMISLVAFLVAIVGFHPCCWAQKTLAWKFKRDGVTNLLIEQNTSMQLEIAGGAAAAANPTQTNQTTNITLTVKEVSLDGVATIEQMINRVQLDLKSGAGNFVIDTNSNTPLTGLAESMAKGIRPLAGARFSVKTKTSGEVMEVLIPEEVSKNLNELGTAGLREIAANASLTFPTKPIDVGENWPTQYELVMPPFGKLIISTTYQYLGEEMVGGKLLDKIKATTAVKVADANANSGLKMKSQESGGTIWFDNTRGTIDHSEFNQEMSMNVLRPNADPAKPGLDMKQIMKQSMKLKYSPKL